MKAEGSAPPSRNASEDQEAPAAFANGEDDAQRGNNYGRPEGQNVRELCLLSVMRGLLPGQLLVRSSAGRHACTAHRL